MQGGEGSVLGQGTEILHVVQCGQEEKKKIKNIKCHLGLRHFSVVQSVDTADNSMEVPQETKARTTI